MSEARFSRIVIGLYHNAPDDSVRVAAEVADLLRVDLLGYFIEEQDLLDLAAMPFVREFRPLGGGWNRLDAVQLARDLDHAARAARRLFEQATRRLGAAAHFRTARGLLAETVGSILRTGDIVIVAESSHPAEQAGGRVDALMQAAFASAAAVLVVPRQIARRNGDVVAVAPDGPALAVAATIAAAAREGLTVIETGRHIKPPEPGLHGPPRIACIRIPEPASPDAVGAALAAVRERLVVVNRDAFDDAFAVALARSRGGPVLVLEPSRRR